MKTKMFFSGLYTAVCLMAVCCEPVELTARDLRLFAAWYAFWIANLCVSANITCELAGKYFENKNRHGKPNEKQD
jgi:hypothetical protein